MKVDLGMQGIGSAHPTKQGQAREQSLSDRDLIRLLGDLDLQERFLTLMGTEGEQMRRMLSGSSRATHGFAIQSNRIFWRGRERSSYPVGEGTFNLLEPPSGGAVCDKANRWG
jgi:hypothetical protein